MPYSILKEKPSIELIKYLEYIKNVNSNIDLELIKNIAIDTIKNFHKKGIQEYTQLLELQEKWYKSCLLNNPDYSIYNNDYYLSELWVCWVIFSRQYLLSILKNKTMFEPHKIESILDLGCGCGYTTLSLKEIFPNSKVIGTNISDTLQTNIAIHIGNIYGFEIINDIDKIKNSVDIVFASEYFEHIESPIQHLIDVVYKTNPKFLIIANAFGGKAIGHFERYNIGSHLIENKKVGRLFNLELRKLGYDKIITGFWNNRPSCWIKKDIL